MIIMFNHLVFRVMTVEIPSLYWIWSDQTDHRITVVKLQVTLSKLALTRVDN